MDTVVKSRESSPVLDCSSQSPGSCDSSSVCLTGYGHSEVGRNGILAARALAKAEPHGSVADPELRCDLAQACSFGP
jgi:hypothetical protein